MIVADFKIWREDKYSDPDYNIIFFDSDGGEIHLGLYKNTIEKMKKWFMTHQ